MRKRKRAVGTLYVFAPASLEQKAREGLEQCYPGVPVTSYSWDDRVDLAVDAPFVPDERVRRVLAELYQGSEHRIVWYWYWWNERTPYNYSERLRQRGRSMERRAR